MKINMSVIKFTLLWVILCCVFVIETNAEKIDLTNEEDAWIKMHPAIRLGFPPGNEPFLIQDQEGSLSGILVDLYNLDPQVF